MAPNLLGNHNHRRKRPRRTVRPPPSASIPRERLPVGALPTRRRSPEPSAHITVVPRRADTDIYTQVDPESSETPVLTKPSFLTETDTGLDLHHRSTNPPRNATFADMARAGLGPSRDYFMNDHMASQEPVPLSHYVKFVRKSGRHKGSSCQLHEESGSWRLRTPESYTEQQDSFTTTHIFVDDSSMGNRPVESWVSSPTKLAGPPIHPVEALQQHFNLVKTTFGRELPPAKHLQANEGQRDGEVQFTIDGGGDVCAHSWSATQYQWVNVGTLSYRRKAIEGSLGVRQLKGQKIGAQMPRNLVEQFQALAKQFEEDNSMTSLSPTSFETNASRTRPVPLVAVPLVSPRPTRPNIAFMPGINLTGSFSSAGLPSRQGGLPTSKTLDLHTPELHRRGSKLSDDQTSNVKISQQTPSGDADMTSTASRGTISPLARRDMPKGSATELPGSQSVFAMPFSHVRQQPVTNNYWPNKIGSNVNVWQEEQSRLQQYGSGSGITRLTQDSVGTKPDERSQDPEQKPKGHGLTWEEATSSRRLTRTHNPTLTTTNRQPGEGWRVIQCAATQPFTRRNQSQVSGGETWQQNSAEDRKTAFIIDPQSEVRKIWGDPWAHRSLSNEELLAKCRNFNPANVNGPFFTAPDDPENRPGFGGDYQSRDKQTWDSLEKTREARVDKMRSEAHALLPRGGKEAEAMVQDPLSQLLWTVKANLNSYKEKEPGTGDYFERLFKCTSPQQTDTSRSSQGIAESSNQASDVVVFKGRSSFSQPFQSTSSTRTITQASSTPTPKQLPRSASTAVHSMGFEEQLKRRGKELSLGW